MITTVRIDSPVGMFIGWGLLVALTCVWLLWAALVLALANAVGIHHVGDRILLFVVLVFDPVMLLVVVTSLAFRRVGWYTLLAVAAGFGATVGSLVEPFRYWP